MQRKWIIFDAMGVIFKVGEIDFNTFWRAMGVCNAEEEEAICKTYLENCLTIDEAFIEVATRLKEKYNLAILSNDVGYRKPDARIYQIAIKKTGDVPENCIFIDDSERNLLAAQKVGMKVIRFIRDEEVSQIEDLYCINTFNQLEEMIQNIF